MRHGIRIPALTAEASLKREIRRHLNAIGFSRSADGLLAPNISEKDAVRNLHLAQRQEKLASSKQFLEFWAPQLICHFADGTEIDVARISPTLERIDADTWQSALFRLASLTWSVPVSNGYGRRLRYLVWDQQSRKLMGIIALGDPVFNLKARDEFIGWGANERAIRLSNMLDAYVLGAVPPFNMLLGGKLVACLIRTREVYDDFKSVYGNSVGTISKMKRRSRLLAVTTSSSMGRSSLYNRLKLGDAFYFRELGFTSGWGHFHIPDQLFDKFRALLKAANHPYATQNRFGHGPNWRLRASREALKLLGMNENLLRHGIGRQVFVSEFAVNSRALLRGVGSKVDLSSLLDIKGVSELALNRWLLPRAQSRPEFRGWRREEICDLIKSTEVGLRRLLPLSR